MPRIRLSILTTGMTKVEAEVMKASAASWASSGEKARSSTVSPARSAIAIRFGKRYCLDIQYRPEERQPLGQLKSRGIAALALSLAKQYMPLAL